MISVKGQKYERVPAPKFIQITGVGPNCYGLDEQKQVWRLDAVKDENSENPKDPWVVGWLRADFPALVPVK